jgi:hypothetical protein
MRVLFVIIAVVFGGAIWLATAASDANDRVARLDGTNAALRSEVARLREETARFEQLDPSELEPASAALSTFFNRAVEAGEALGVGIRVESRNNMLGQTSLTFEDSPDGLVGISVCRLNVRASIEGEEAVPLLAMMEEEIAELPVTVQAVNVRRSGADFGLVMEVDVYGRTP